MQHIDPGDRVDPRAVLCSLGYVDTSEPERVPGGWDTLLWRFATPDGKEHSLRMHFLPGREQMAWRERIALETCERVGLPAPRVETAGEFDGMPVLVLSWCSGITLLSLMERRPWTLWSLARMFGRTQACIHATPPPAELASTAPANWASRVPPEYVYLAERTLAIGAATDSFIHMDYHPMNVVGDGKRVTGVVDWARCGAGDRRADLARTAITMIAAPVPPGPLRPILNLARRAALRAWRRGYEETAGAMPDYRPFMAWAGATLLCEVQQIIDRPNVWGTREDLERLRRLIGRWEAEGDRH